MARSRGSCASSGPIWCTSITCWALASEAIRAARRALGPSVPIVLTLHEYLSICHHHGQMVTPGGALCERASALACGQCFPEVGAGRLRRRELFLKSFYRQVDAFVSPSRFLADR